MGFKRCSQAPLFTQDTASDSRLNGSRPDCETSSSGSGLSSYLTMRNVLRSKSQKKTEKPSQTGMQVRLKP